jgi:signal transduction histidine kinase
MPASGRQRPKAGRILAKTRPHPGGLAHDINNLLTIIAANNALLAENPAVAPLAAASLAAARSAAALVRLLAPQARPEPVLLDVNEVVGELLALLAPVLGDAVTVQTQLAKARLAVRSDRAQLLSAALNLALNARDAMPDGGTMRILTARRGDRIVLEIADTGSGMSKAVQARATKRAFTTKRRGSGLGLSQVAAFARHAGGSLRIASTPGSGTTVSLQLPRAGR